ncbi:MAG: hypothetical protein JWM80_4168 [Cyanobacteria bacterium RYN_339]|nr:hypothetical protein [Cyanobacteria bacterium RYN_339]
MLACDMSHRPASRSRRMLQAGGYLEMATTLEDLSRELDISPSGLRKRIHALGLTVEKGSRGKWFISDDLLQVLRDADRMMKDGAGAATTRRVLGLEVSVSAEPPRLALAAPSDASGEKPCPTTELQQALGMLAAERQRSEVLQARVSELLARVAELTGACAMFQERTKHLATSLSNLQQKELLRLEAPASAARPWWQLWPGRSGG